MFDILKDLYETMPYFILFIIIIIAMIIWAFVYRIFFFVGKYVIKAFTLNRYPSSELSAKEKDKINEFGFAITIATICIYFFIRNN